MPLLKTRYNSHLSFSIVVYKTHLRHRQQRVSKSDDRVKDRGVAGLRELAGIISP